MRSALVCFVLTLAFSGAATARQADPLHQAADAYAAFQIDLTTSLDADISSTAAMDAALQRSAHVDPAALARGRVAYAALTAAQLPAFVRGVRDRVRAAGRAAVLRQLQRDPTYARRRPPGADEAIALVLSTNAADTARIEGAARRYESIGHAIDGAAWDMPLDPAQRDARDQTLRALARASATVLAPELALRTHVAADAGDPVHNIDAFGGARFWDALGDRSSPAPQIDVPRLRPDHAAQMDRVLTLAALFIIGATPAEQERVNAALDDPLTTSCLTLEQLEFRQCLSVVHAPDEDAFCLARHGMSGPAQCFAALWRNG